LTESIQLCYHKSSVCVIFVLDRLVLSHSLRLSLACLNALYQFITTDLYVFRLLETSIFEKQYICTGLGIMTFVDISV